MNEKHELVRINYLSEIATPLVPIEFKGNVKIGKIILYKHYIVGSGSVVLPDVIFNEGACLGALSLAKTDLEEYSLYAGIPSKIIKKRDKAEILRLERKFINESR